MSAGIPISLPSASTPRGGAGVLQRLDARVKIMLTLALIIGTLCVSSLWGLATLAAFTLLAYLAARVPARLALTTAAPLLIIAAITALCNLLFTQGGEVYLSWGILQITSQGCYSALFFGARLAVLVFMACLLVLTTPTLQIIQGAERLLHPLRRLGIPVHEMTMMAGIALRFVPEFARELITIRQAREARCARLSQGSLRRRLHNVVSMAQPLFRSAFHRSETLANAMDSRCYRATETRSALHPLKLHAIDAAASLAAAATVALAVLL